MTDARSLFQQLIGHSGKEIYKDPTQFTSSLNDYFGGQFKGERNVLISSIRGGVPDRLLKNRDSLPYPTLKSQCINLILQDGFEPGLAQWAVDTWAIVLDVVEEKNCTPLSQPEKSTLQSKIRIKNKARLLFLNLITRYGTEIYREPDKFKNLLSDYFTGHYKSERNVLIHAIDAGVPEKLSANRGTNYTSLQSQSIDLIMQEGFGKPLAQWAVDTWAIGLKIIDKKDTEQPGGYLEIISVPAGGNVYLDNTLQGTTPLILTSVFAGPHHVKCTLDGYQSWEKTINIDPEEPETVSVAFQPKSGKLLQSDIPATVTPASSLPSKSVPPPAPLPGGPGPGGQPRNKKITSVFVICLLLTGMLLVPTRTVAESVTVPYTDTETYYIQEPYDAQEAYQVQEPYQTTQMYVESIKSYNRINAPSGSHFETDADDITSDGCDCSGWTNDLTHNPNQVCIQKKCPTTSSDTRSSPVTKYRTVTKYHTITKYRNISQTREVTKTRTEVREEEVNWIFGFKTPYKFHILNST